MYHTYYIILERAVLCAHMSCPGLGNRRHCNLLDEGRQLPPQEDTHSALWRSLCTKKQNLCHQDQFPSCGYNILAADADSPVLTKFRQLKPRKESWARAAQPNCSQLPGTQKLWEIKTRVTSSYNYLHKTCVRSSQFSSMDGEGVHKPHLQGRNYWQFSLRIGFFKILCRLTMLQLMCLCLCTIWYQWNIYFGKKKTWHLGGVWGRWGNWKGK